MRTVHHVLGLERFTEVVRAPMKDEAKIKDLFERLLDNGTPVTAYKHPGMMSSERVELTTVHQVLMRLAAGESVETDKGTFRYSPKGDRGEGLYFAPRGAKGYEPFDYDPDDDRL